MYAKLKNGAGDLSTTPKRIESFFLEEFFDIMNNAWRIKFMVKYTYVY